VAFVLQAIFISLKKQDLHLINKYMNRIIIIGNLGKDPEVKEFESGNKVVNFSVATSEKYTNKAGERVEETEWHNVKFFGKLAEVCEKYLSKGSKVMVEGKMSTRSYESNGETKYVTEIVGQNMEMLGGNPSGAEAPKQEKAKPKAKKSEPLPNQEPKTGAAEEDDLPF